MDSIDIHPRALREAAEMILEACGSSADETRHRRRPPGAGEPLGPRQPRRRHDPRLRAQPQQRDAEAEPERRAGPRRRRDHDVRRRHGLRPGGRPPGDGGGDRALQEHRRGPGAGPLLPPPGPDRHLRRAGGRGRSRFAPLRQRGRPPGPGRPLPGHGRPVLDESDLPVAARQRRTAAGSSRHGDQPHRPRQGAGGAQQGRGDARGLPDRPPRPQDPRPGRPFPSACRSLDLLRRPQGLRPRRLLRAPRRHDERRTHRPARARDWRARSSTTCS